MQATTTDDKTKKRHSRFFGQRIVKQRFQLWLSFTVLFIMSVSCVLSWYAGKVYIDHLFRGGLAAPAELVPYLRTLNIIVGMTSALFLSVGVLLMVLFSHTIAGPILRFEWALDRLKEGDLTPRIRLRKGDQFMDVAERFNDTFEALRRRITEQRSEVDDIRNDLLSLAGQARQDGRKDDAVLFERYAQELNDALGIFKTRQDSRQV